jgi:hypothetical protein
MELPIRKLAGTYRWKYSHRSGVVNNVAAVFSDFYRKIRHMETNMDYAHN